MPDISLTMDRRSPETLTPHEHNSKLHPESQVAQIARSIEKFGFNDPIAVNESGVILEGEGRWRAAKSLGLEDVPVIVISGLTERQQDLYRIGHNKIALSTGFDMDRLVESLREVTGGDAQITADDLGFSDRSANNVIKAFSGGSVSTSNTAPKPTFDIVWDNETQRSRWNEVVAAARSRFPEATDGSALLSAIDETGITRPTQEEEAENVSL